MLCWPGIFRSFNKVEVEQIKNYNLHFDYSYVWNDNHL